MATLTTMIDRVEALLIDSSNVIFTTATITEGIRLAMGEYSTANEAAVTLEGLDGALTSTLPAVHESLIVIGGAGYTVQARAVDRIDSYQEGGEADKLKTWGDARLKEFKAMLGFVYPGYLVTLAGSSGSEDAGKIAAEIALMGAQSTLAAAQADLAAAQAAAAIGQEGRAAAAAGQAAADKAAEAERRADLRNATHSPWGRWEEKD